MGKFIQRCLGFLILGCLLPFVGVVVGTGVLWDALDRLFMGKPLTGILYKTAQAVNRGTEGFNSRFVKHREDGFVINTIVLLGIGVPLFFTYCYFHTVTYGFSVWLCFAYNVVRIGPYFMHFAYVYTLCHKECHSATGYFKKPYNPVLRHVFNWWIGLFYGVSPASFACGHSKNHHTYNNGELDVVTSADEPRDSFLNYVAYIPRFFLYATNISTVYQFFVHGEYALCLRMIAGSSVQLAFVALCWKLHPLFAFGYALYPLFENVILLSAVGYCWHAFLDPADPLNQYTGSITIFDGQINVMQEDLHVVHHQYPGVHWTKHPELFKKHLKEYETQNATIFRDSHTFELFFLIILKKYDELAAKFVDLSGKMSHDDKVHVIKERLRACSWGPHANLTVGKKQS